MYFIIKTIIQIRASIRQTTTQLVISLLEDPSFLLQITSDVLKSIVNNVRELIFKLFELFT